MKIPLGFILMVLGIVGVARGAVNYMTGQPANSLLQGQIHTLPLAPLIAAFFFVGGLLIVARKDVFPTESSADSLRDSPLAPRKE